VGVHALSAYGKPGKESVDMEEEKEGDHLTGRITGPPLSTLAGLGMEGA